MAKKKAEAEQGQDQETVRVATVHDKTIVNGHVLPKGTVTRMSAEDVARHRGAGVPLDDVEDHDEREDYDTSEPYVAEDKGEESGAQ